MNFALSVSAHPVCNFVTHERCIPDLKVPCRHVMADMIQVRREHKQSISIDCPSLATRVECWFLISTVSVRTVEAPSKCNTAIT